MIGVKDFEISERVKKHGNGDSKNVLPDFGSRGRFRVGDHEEHENQTTRSDFGSEKVNFGVLCERAQKQRDHATRAHKRKSDRPGFGKVGRADPENEDVQYRIETHTEVVGTNFEIVTRNQNESGHDGDVGGIEHMALFIETKQILRGYRRDTEDDVRVFKTGAHEN